VIHKIKGLYDQSRGLSVRAISRELGISRNTVRKYLQLDEVQISAAIADPSRTKLLDQHRDYLINQLGQFPALSAVKLARRLRERTTDLAVSDRSIRRYVQALKQQVASGQLRYYEPVVESVPGVQCQVDPGELRGVMIGGLERVVHFVVFVLSCSRLMYVGLDFRPLDTERFIQMHDEAFRYFGGVTEECIYDQTKMVVINEQYRELTLNQRFHQYATTVGYRIHACEGYDPESKGKVESGVKYVKRDCFYGEQFQDENAVREHLHDWLETVANARLHGTTGHHPRAHFETLERAQLKPYLVPQSLLHVAQAIETRKVDKTGLISWQANKYSVPMAWQQARVGVSAQDDQLLIHDLESGELIATHDLCKAKGRMVKNNNHYRDHAQRIANLEHGIDSILPDGLGATLCQLLKRTSPCIYKDQLVAARDLLMAHAPVDTTLLGELCERSELTATGLKRYLEAWQQAKARGRVISDQDYAPVAGSQVSHADLNAYARVGQSTGHGVTP